MFHDALMGWSHARQVLEKFIASDMAQGKSLEDARGRLFTYGKGDEKWRRLHTSKIGEVLDRCQPHASNERILANQCFVSICSFWERKTRGAIAKACGVSIVEHELFGEIYKLRNWILHANRAPAEINRFRILKWFNPGDEMILDREKLLEMVDLIRFELPNGLICRTPNADQKLARPKDFEIDPWTAPPLRSD